jgi:hypothetical protein
MQQKEEAKIVRKAVKTVWSNCICTVVIYVKHVICIANFVILLIVFQLFI